MTFYDSFSLFDQILGAVLPAGEGSVVAFSHVYFDESGTHDGSRVLGMAGYWFSAEQARKFSRDWARDLKHLGITAAHMTDCALGFGEYKSLSMEQRIQSEKLLIAHIKRRSKFSIAACVSPYVYDEIFKNIKGAPSAYTFLLLLCVNKIAEYIEQTKYNGKVAYFFEAGHAKASEANKYMNAIPKFSNMKLDKFRYASHTFVDKRISLPLQAADMLVWQTRHYLERAIDGHEEPRKDFKALMRTKDLFTVIEPDHLHSLAEIYANADNIFGESLYDNRKPIKDIELADKILESFGLDRNFAAKAAEEFARSKR